jgi:hypothetical protein
MTNDQKATISGLISAIGAALLAWFPQYPWLGGVITSVGIAVLGWYTNKPNP